MKRLLLVPLLLLLGAEAAQATSSDCLVTSSAPTLTPNTSAPCFLTPTGDLRTTGSGGGSGVSVVEDTVHVSGENIAPLGCRRKSTAASSAGADGRWATVDCTDNGEVRVHVQSTSVGSTSTDDDGAVPPGTPNMSEVINRNYRYDGTGWVRDLADPCSLSAKTFLPINISAATTTEITPSLAGASTHYYICSLNLVTNAANNVLVADDDTDNCASPTSGIFGSDSSPAAGEGWNFAANGGIALGNGGSSIGRTGGANRVVCILTSAATQLSGMMTVVAAP